MISWRKFIPTPEFTFTIILVGIGAIVIFIIAYAFTYNYKPDDQGGEDSDYWISSVCRYEPPIGVWIVRSDTGYDRGVFIREMTEREFEEYCK